MEVSASDDVNTNFMQATMNGDKASLEDAFAKGVNLDVTNCDGDTALICAMRFGCRDIIKYLVSKGANLDTKNNNGETALIFSCKFKYSVASKRFQGYKNFNTFQYLDNPDEESRDECFNTYDLYAIVESLITAGCNYMLTDNEGKTALDYIKESYKMDVFKVNTPAKKGQILFISPNIV